MNRIRTSSICSCTMSWCENQRREWCNTAQLEGLSMSELSKRFDLRTFSLPYTKSIIPEQMEAINKQREAIQSRLRRGSPILTASNVKFLYWHLKPSSFTWKDSFSRNATKCVPTWIVHASSRSFCFFNTVASCLTLRSVVVWLFANVLLAPSKTRMQ